MPPEIFKNFANELFGFRFDAEKTRYRIYILKLLVKDRSLYDILFFFISHIFEKILRRKTDYGNSNKNDKNTVKRAENKAAESIELSYDGKIYYKVRKPPKDCNPDSADDKNDKECGNTAYYCRNGRDHKVYYSSLCLLYTLLFDRKITACGFIDIDIEKICYIDKKVGTVIEKRVKIESRNRCIYIFRSRRKLVYEPLAHRIMNVVFIKICSEIFGEKECGNKGNYLSEKADNGAYQTFSATEDDAYKQNRNDQ